MNRRTNPFASIALVLVMEGIIASVSAFQLHGSGTTNPSKCYWDVMDAMRSQSSEPIYLSYRSVGSKLGMEVFAEQFQKDTRNVFGSGDIPIQLDLYQQINAPDEGNPSPRRFVHLPVLAGSISLFHSIPDTENLNLTACIISDIYMQKITT